MFSETLFGVHFPKTFPKNASSFGTFCEISGFDNEGHITELYVIIGGLGEDMICIDRGLRVAEQLPAQIMRQLPQVANQYHRLLLVVSPSGTGKTDALREVAEQTGTRYINVNLELSRRLLELTQRQRKLFTPRLLEDIVGQDIDQIVLLDNLEVLFDPSLQLHPLRCLQDLARRRTVVAAWNGTLTRGHLTYATPDHPEYRRYPIDDITVVSPEVST